MRRKISPKFHVKNGVKNGQFHANFTLLGRSADDSLKVVSNRRPMSLLASGMMILSPVVAQAPATPWSLGMRTVPSPALLWAFLRR